MNKNLSESETLKKLADIYFNLKDKPQGSVMANFLPEKIEQGSRGIVLELVSTSDDTFPFDSEENLRTMLLSEGINLERVRTRKTPRRFFTRQALDWEIELHRKLGYDIGDKSNSQDYLPKLLTLAKDMRASDIHLYPGVSEEGNTLGLVKFRIDGRLQNVDTLKEGDFMQFTDALRKKASETHLDNLVLDGSFQLDDPEVQYRLASMITSFRGSKNKLYSTVVRLLLTKNVDLSLEHLGYIKHDADTLRDLVRGSSGFVVVAGTTGMGKTTTLCSLVNEIAEKSEGSRRIITFEDPMEYDLSNIATQFRVRDENGDNGHKTLTFKMALENCLRQDPDVIMVGETRSHETGNYLADTAETGHLLLTTLHGKSAIGALSRLAEMGISGSTMNNTLLGIVFQILVRQNCTKCLEERPFTNEEIDYLFPNTDKVDKSLYNKFRMEISKVPVKESRGKYKGALCEKCEGLRFYGRFPIVEIYSHNMAHSNIIKSICDGKPEGPAEMQKLFLDGTYDPIGWKAVHRVLKGFTTPSEIIDHLGSSYFKDYAPYIISKTVDWIKKHQEK